jgi:hypothetical protein
MPGVCFSCYSCGRLLDVVYSFCPDYISPKRTSIYVSQTFGSITFEVASSGFRRRKESSRRSSETLGFNMSGPEADVAHHHTLFDDSWPASSGVSRRLLLQGGDGSSKFEVCKQSQALAKASLRVR